MVSVCHPLILHINPHQGLLGLLPDSQTPVEIMLDQGKNKTPHEERERGVVAQWGSKGDITVAEDV